MLFQLISNPTWFQQRCHSLEPAYIFFMADSSQSTFTVKYVINYLGV